MKAHSPRPTAHRVGTILLAVFLVGSLLAPIAATAPVAAQDDSIEVREDCGSVARFVAPRACQAAAEAFGSVDQGQDAAAIEKDIHVGASGVKSSQESTDQLLRNYLQDTDSIASMEARHAISTAYENGESPGVADTRAQNAINDYYARLQIQLLEETSLHSDQLAYYANISQNESGILNDFVHVNAGSTEKSYPTGRTVETDVELANGSTHPVTLPEIHFNKGDNYQKDAVVNVFSDTLHNETYYEEYVADSSSTAGSTAEYYGTVHLLNTGSLESKTVYDYRLARERFDEIENQSDTVVSNYDSGTAEDFYTALDNDQIETEDLRGAEGMVRYLSGDANVTDDRYQYALRSVLDMDRSSLDSTMVVHFEGATERDRITHENGSVSYEYNSVNETYEGLLFSSETPADGFQTGVSYDVSNLSGRQKMVTGGDDGDTSDVVFHRGTFTIEEMTDGDGNEINQTDLSDKPDYGTFNATEYQKTIDQADSERETITDTYDGGGGGPLLGGGGGWVPESGGDKWLAAAFLIAIIAIAAAMVTNLADSLGP
ncbi:hypothetical protein [Natrinema ejinorense]|nr:hypothetical protein [Natrinema ejinorense]